jgi:aldehyde dehydrogenase (NAD+)
VTELLIDGRLVAGGSGTFDTINPTTRRPCRGRWRRGFSWP